MSVGDEERYETQAAEDVYYELAYREAPQIIEEQKVVTDREIKVRLEGEAFPGKSGPFPWVTGRAMGQLLRENRLQVYGYVGRRRIKGGVTNKFYCIKGTKYDDIKEIIRVKRRISADVNNLLTGEASASYHAEDVFLEALETDLDCVHIERNGVSISPVKMELFRAFGALPGTGDRHVAEFFGHFLTKDTDAGLKYGVRLTTIEDRLQWRARDLERVNKMLSGEMTIEMSRSEETASKIISAIANGRCEIDVLNLPNKGQVNNLPRDAIVETYGVVGPGGAEGIAVGDVPPAVQAILHQHIVKHELTVDATLNGDRALALQALLLDPLILWLEISIPLRGC